MRLGLAMTPLLLASDLFPFPAFLLLAAVKICGQALITGTLFSPVFLFSAAGTMLSALSMYGARRLFGKNIGFAGTGVLGAMVSNTAQLALARVFVFGKAAWYAAPPFLAAGLLTGAALGFFCEHFSRNSAWYAQAKNSGAVSA
jgi:heptaprenyl diphosphate synthase